jgi:hypothetical protein
MASRSLGSLTLDLIARVGGFEKGMDRAARAASDRSRRIDRSMQKLKRTVLSAFAVIGGAAIFRNIIQSTIEAENVYRQLEARVKSTGQVAGFTADELLGLAQDFQRVSTFGDEAIAAMQSVLLTFTQVRGDEFVDATEAILNMSVALGKNLQESALQVGKALNDPILGVSALREAGVQLSEQQADLVRSLTKTGDIAGAQRVILAELETQFGGSARAAADTFGGALTQVRNAFGDLLEAPGGMNDAKSALQDLADLLQDPGTIAAAGELTSALIRGFSAATAAVIGLSAAFLEIEPVEFEREIKRARRELEGFEAIRQNMGGADQSFWPPGLVEDLERAQTELDRLIFLQEKARGVGVGGAQPLRPAGQSDDRTPIVTPPSEQFVKLQEQLQQQIALFEETGQAARLAYQIASGSLEGLTAAEQDQILALAAQLDGLTESAEAMRALEAEATKLAQAFDSQVTAYERQIEMTGELTELEKIRYEIASGGLAGLTETQQAELETLAATIDANRELQSVMDRGREITESVITPAERLRDTYAELNDLLNAGAISYETYLRAVVQAQDGLAEVSEQFDTVRDQLMRNTQDIFADTLFSQFEDGLDGMFDAFRDMLLKMAAQAAAARLTEKIFGDIGTGDDAGGFAKFIGSIFGGGRATGGPVTAGRLYRVNENEPEYFVPGSSGAVVPLSKMGAATVINFSIQAPQGSVSRATQAQIGYQVERGLVRAARRNG